MILNHQKIAHADILWFSLVHSTHDIFSCELFRHFEIIDHQNRIFFQILKLHILILIFFVKELKNLGDIFSDTYRILPLQI